MSPANDAGGAPRYLVIGEVLRPHGVAGELRMRILTAYPERLNDLKTVYLDRNPETQDAAAHTVEGVRMHQQYALLKLAGVDDRDAADLFRQLYVLVPVEAAVPLEAGEVYLYQLIGLTVQTQDGQLLGKLVEVLETGANDVFVIDSPRYGEVLIPDTEETILDIDVETGLMVVSLPEGLLPGS
jgi:16S rRNA processing protein RimM